MYFALSRRLAAICAALLCAAVPSAVRAAGPLVQLSGHVRPAPADAKLVSRVSAGQTINLSIALPLRNEEALKGLIARLYNPADSLYGQFLTPEAFAEGYAPTASDYAAVEEYLKANGFTVTHEYSNRLLIDVSGTASSAESAFHVNLNQYQSASGRSFHMPDSNPSLPSEIASKVISIIGLDNSAQIKPNLRAAATKLDLAKSSLNGDGYGGSFGPVDLHDAYGLNTASLSAEGLPATLNGARQTVAVVEYDGGYLASDISTYTNYYSAFFGSGYSAPLKAISVGGYPTSAPGENNDEATLDIDCVLNIAPQLTKLLVFELPSDGTIVEALDAIATDTTDTGTGAVSNMVSISYGLGEDEVATSTLSAENSALEQLESLGVAVFTASGDAGAFADYDPPDDTSLEIIAQDPATQPLITAVGGTSLSEGSGFGYGSEVVWNDSAVSGEPSDGISGGGISQYWPIPSYQSTYIPLSNTSGRSTTYRNVPDVALNSDQNNLPYGIYINAEGGWNGFGGTSAATPTWAGFFALVNQERLAVAKTQLGFVNPALYALYDSSSYGSDFHDITSGNNGIPTRAAYSAAAGYDLTTGLGSFVGAHLIHDLSLVPTVTTTTALASSLNPSVQSQSVTFTATISPAVPNGETVTFYSNGSSIGTGATSGSVATFSTTSLPVGTESITATYPGDTTYISSSSAALSQTVDSLATTTTAVTSSLNPSAVGQSVTFTATVSPSVPDGETITFLDSGSSIGTATTTGSAAALTTSTLAAGRHSITASYPGDSSNAASTSSTLIQVVNTTGTATTTIVTSSANPSALGASVTFTATISPSVPDGETVTFYDGGASLGTGNTSGSAATFSTASLAPGSDSITATYGGDSTFASSTSAALTQTVNGSLPSYAAGLCFFSSPYDYPGVSLDTLFGYSGVELAVFDPSAYVYDVTPNGAADSIRLGVGYWGNLPQGVTFTSVGTPASTSSPFTINLIAGWNQIGDPFTSSILLTSLTFGSSNVPFSQATAGSSPLVDPTLWSYSSSANSGGGGYTAASSLIPLQALWVYAFSTTTMNVPPP